MSLAERTGNRQEREREREAALLFGAMDLKAWSLRRNRKWAPPRAHNVCARRPITILEAKYCMHANSISVISHFAPSLMRLPTAGLLP